MLEVYSAILRALGRGAGEFYVANHKSVNLNIYTMGSSQALRAAHQCCCISGWCLALLRGERNSLAQSALVSPSTLR